MKTEYINIKFIAPGVRTNEHLRVLAPTNIFWVFAPGTAPRFAALLEGVRWREHPEGALWCEHAEDVRWCENRLGDIV